MLPRSAVTAPYAFEHAFPTPDGAENVFDDQDLQRAIEAYRFFYPTVSMEAILEGNRRLGIEDGQGIILLASKPHHVVLTANSDTPYACGVLDLRAMGPVVVNMPAGAFMGMIDDHNHRWVADLGIPGPDAGRGGKYLVLPPDFDGDTAAGYHVVRSPTFKALLALRALPHGGDVAEALRALTRVEVHALGRPDAALPFTDVTDRSMDSTPLRWEGNLDYWRKLHAVLQFEPALDEFRPIYGALAALGIEKGKPFAPDARAQRILGTAARVARDQMLVEGFANGRPDRMVWDDRHWEWIALVTDDPNFETEHFMDLQARERWFIQAIGSSPAMFGRKAGAGSIYFLAARDAKGAYLDGDHTYKLTVPQPVPATMFWSVTAYDARTRSQVQAPQGKAVLSSLSETFEPGDEGSVELYFGPRAPAGAQARWIQTLPGAGFFLYFRIYGPEPACLDGTWKPGDLARVDAWFA